MEIILRFIGHSGIFVSLPGTGMLFDYYTGDFPKAELSQKHNAYIFVSHSHYDHYQPVIHEAALSAENIRYIFSSDVQAPAQAHLSPGESYCDDNLAVQAFASTDLGVSFLVQTQGITIFHAGDYNLWSWRDESSPREIAQATDDFMSILSQLTPHPVDIAFFPWDPRMKTRFDEGFLRYVEAVRPRYIMPIHFGNDFSALSQWAAAQSLPSQLLIPIADGHSFTITI